MFTAVGVIDCMYQITYKCTGIHNKHINKYLVYVFIDLLIFSPFDI